MVHQIFSCSESNGKKKPPLSDAKNALLVFCTITAPDATMPIVWYLAIVH